MRPLARSLGTSLVVGSAVSIGHFLFPGAGWWPIVHFLLPFVVFSLSAWAAGSRKITRPLVLRCAATVAIVGLSFTAINTIWTLAPWLRVVLNYLVPFVVATVGQMSSSSASADPR